MNYSQNTGKYVDIILDESHKNAIDAINLQKNSKTLHSKEVLFVAQTLFEPLSEVIGTIEIINMIPTFIKTFPYNGKGMLKARYLQYHIGNYFVEIGNLYYRLDEHLGSIKNKYRKIDGNRPRIEQLTKTLRKYVETVLNGPIGIRNNHVHHFRYTDKELDHLLELELITMYTKKVKEKISFEQQSEYAFKQIRKKWNTLIKENNKQLEEILDFYFDVLIKIVAPNGSIIYPFNNKNS